MVRYPVISWNIVHLIDITILNINNRLMIHTKIFNYLYKSSLDFYLPNFYNCVHYR